MNLGILGDLLEVALGTACFLVLVTSASRRKNKEIKK